MARKVFLPLTQLMSDSISKPNAIAMRKRLGGRLTSESALARPDGSIFLGAFVTVQERDAAPVVEPDSADPRTPRVGVLLAIGEAAVDVYLERGIVKRTAPELITAHRGPPPGDLAPVSESVLVFARLVEGQRVEIERGPGDIVSATLVEKCRYGALVELDDRSLLGVGFRKVWPKRISARPDDQPS